MKATIRAQYLLYLAVDGHSLTNRELLTLLEGFPHYHACFERIGANVNVLI